MNALSLRPHVKVRKASPRAGASTVFPQRGAGAVVKMANMSNWTSRQVVHTCSVPRETMCTLIDVSPLHKCQHLLGNECHSLAWHGGMPEEKTRTNGCPTWSHDMQRSSPAGTAPRSFPFSAKRDFPEEGSNFVHTNGRIRKCFLIL